MYECVYEYVYKCMYKYVLYVYGYMYMFMYVYIHVHTRVCVQVYESVAAAILSGAIAFLYRCMAPSFLVLFLSARWMHCWPATPQPHPPAHTLS